MTTVFRNAVIDGVLSDFTVTDGLFGKILPAGSLSGGTDCGGAIVIPGFIDIHTHGVLGFDTMEGHLDEMARYQAKNGTTSFYPTTMTMGYEDIRKAVSVDPASVGGARLLGFHLEGPFISRRYKGAQNEKYLALPDADFVLSLPHIGMITLAPELPGGLEFIRRMKDAGIRVAIGHTEATYDETRAAIAAGADCLTHTCNAMPPLLHRAPGPIGAGMEAGIYAQVIADGLHLHYAMVKALVKLFGKDRIVFISDALRATGLGDGDYVFGGQNIRVQNGEARLADGTLAGSTSLLLKCARTALANGFTLRDIVRFACENPARLMGVNAGRIAEGFFADFLLTDENLSDLRAVYIGGNIFD